VRFDAAAGQPARTSVTAISILRRVVVGVLRVDQARPSPSGRVAAATLAEQDASPAVLMIAARMPRQVGEVHETSNHSSATGASRSISSASCSTIAACDSEGQGLARGRSGDTTRRTSSAPRLTSASGRGRGRGKAGTGHASLRLSYVYSPRRSSPNQAGTTEAGSCARRRGIYRRREPQSTQVQVLHAQASAAATMARYANRTSA